MTDPSPRTTQLPTPPSTPLVLLTGVDPAAMADTLVAVQFDLPGAVVVRHHIDVERRLLTRTVSDITGVVEVGEVDLEHACVSCAVREDVLPTLARLAGQRRWGSIVAHLPVGAAADQVCDALAPAPGRSAPLHVSAVVAALTGETLVEDLLGDALLVERDLHSADDDRRGVGEVACAQVEHADVVALVGGAEERGVAYVGGLLRPGSLGVVESTALPAGDLVRGVHTHVRTSSWTDAVLEEDLPPAPAGTWRIDLRSAAPFHPGRLLQGLERLGAGRHRSRGCFWLPTRPDDVLAWDGAGGQLAVGRERAWAGTPRRTRLVVSGVGTAPAHLEAAFDSLLVRPEEAEATGWLRGEDGFEPWLGPISRVA